MQTAQRQMRQAPAKLFILSKVWNTRISPHQCKEFGNVRLTSSSKGLYCNYSHVGTVIATNKDDISLPAAFFLNHDAFHWQPKDFPPVGLHVPPYVASELGDTAAIRSIAQLYFDTVHLWMPIVSRQRFFEHVQRGLTETRTDFALLCLSMKLITTIPSTDSPDEHNPNYLSAKLLLHEITMSRSLTVATLQSIVILALYEIGHAIYPAAHISVSLCAQYGLMLGLDWESLRQRSDLPWVELEEQRRIWWAIVILDRYASYMSFYRLFVNKNCCQVLLVGVVWASSDHHWASWRGASSL